MKKIYKISKFYITMLFVVLLIIAGIFLFFNNDGLKIKPNLIFKPRKLIWSADMGTMNFSKAKNSCFILGGNWRLPVKEELRTALFDQFKNGGSNPGGFQSGAYYWSGSITDGGTAWFGYTHDAYIGYGSGSRNNENSVRCVYSL